MLTIGFVGIIFNVVCLAVLAQKKELKLSSDYLTLLRTQSVFDLLYLLTSTPVTALPYLFHTFNVFYNFAVVLPWIFPFVQITMIASIYTTVALAFER